MKYGVFDIGRLLQTLVVRRGSDDFYLAVAEDGHHALEQFILAKYYLTSQVYCHRIRLITDAMLTRVVRLGVLEDNIQFLRDLFIFEPGPAYLANYVRWTDQTMAVALLKDHADTLAGGLFRAISERRLWKLVFDAKVSDFENPFVRNRLMAIDDSDIRAIEQAVAGQLPCEPEFVTFRKFALKSVREMSRNDEATVLVDRRGMLLEFDSVSTLFASIDKEMNELIVHVYAQYDYGDDMARKAKLKLEHHEKIKGILTEVLSRGEENADGPEAS